MAGSATETLAPKKASPAPDPRRPKGPQPGSGGAGGIRRQLQGMNYEEGSALLSPSGTNRSHKTTGAGDTAAQERKNRGGTGAAASPSIPAGTFGMVTGDTDLEIAGGMKIALQAGDAVQVTGIAGDRLKVKAWSGRKGLEGQIPAAKFKAQPRLTQKDDKSGPEDHVYQKYVGELFLGQPGAKGAGSPQPKLSDVDQGAVGDCFLLAALGSVVAARPDIIRNMVSYDATTKTYTVTFQELQADRTFKPHKEVVDAWLPSRAGSAKPQTVYAQSDKPFDPKNQALWPAIIEKAYAQWKGGYHKIDEGGQASEAMQAITGVRSVPEAIPAVKDVIPTFQKFQKDRKAVTCGTRDWVQQSSRKGLFSGSGDGPLAGTLTDVNGAAAELVKSSIRVSNPEGKSGAAVDDGKGKMSGGGVRSGSVAYPDGKVSLAYEKGKGPKAAADLEASYRYEGLLSSTLNLHGDHAYIFREVRDGLLYFHNPHGPAAHKHPKGISAADFVAYFETIGTNAPVPQKAK